MPTGMVLNQLNIYNLDKTFFLLLNNQMLNLKISKIITTYSLNFIRNIKYKF